MRKFIKTCAALVAVVLLCAGNSNCDGATTVKSEQANKAQAAANSLRFTENAEIDNIKHRLELTANPGLLGFVVLLNQAGQPIMHTAVHGKVTSGSKRLTAISEIRCVPSYDSQGRRDGCNYATVPAPSDEGTYGSSGEYVYFWTPSGQYIQWNGAYLYSDKPFRLKIEPLVVSVTDTASR